MSEDRVVAPEEEASDAPEASLRPAVLDEFVGQKSCAGTCVSSSTPRAPAARPWTTSSSTARPDWARPPWPRSSPVSWASASAPPRDR